MNHQTKPFTEPNALQPGFNVLGVGGKTSYPPFEGAALSIGPSGLSLVVSLSSPAKSEMRALKRGAIDIGLMLSGGCAIVLWRFADKPRPVTLETPFHIGLLPPQERWIPTGHGEQSHNVLITVQDQHCICRAIRLFSIPVSCSRAIERIVAKQAAEASQPGWTRAFHDRDVDRYFQTYRDPAQAMKACKQGASLGGCEPVDMKLN